MIPNPLRSADVRLSDESVPDAIKFGYFADGHHATFAARSSRFRSDISGTATQIFEQRIEEEHREREKRERERERAVTQRTNPTYEREVTLRSGLC